MSFRKEYNLLIAKLASTRFPRKFLEELTNSVSSLKFLFNFSRICFNYLSFGKKGLAGRLLTLIA